MEYPETLLTAVFFLAAGAAAGCGCCVVAAALFRRACRLWRISAACVLMSIAVAAAAAMFVMTPEVSAHLGRPACILWYGSFFVAGIICSVFYLFAVPFFFIIYVSFAVFSCHVLHSHFKVLPYQVTVSVHDGLYESDVMSGSIVNDLNGKACIVLYSYSIPPVLLIPFSRTWYEAPDRQKQSFYSGNAGKGTGYLADRYAAFLSCTRRAVFVPVPAGASMPAMYILDSRKNPPVLEKML